MMKKIGIPSFEKFGIPIFFIICVALIFIIITYKSLFKTIFIFALIEKRSGICDLSYDDDKKLKKIT